jgi:hypothetical protein
MRVNNKGGVTPRDRRLGRGLVAIAAVAVILFSATSASAVPLVLAIDPGLSFLDTDLAITPAALGYTATFYFDFIDYDGDTSDNGGYPLGMSGADPSNVTSLSGTLLMDFLPGVSIDFSPGSSITPAVQGIYIPDASVGPGTPAPGQQGFQIYSDTGLTTTAGYARLYGVTSDMGTASTATPDGGGAMPIIGPDTFAPLDNAFVTLTGAIDFVSALGTDTSGADGLPIVFSLPITFDGTTLTIPYDFSFTTGSMEDGDDLFFVHTSGLLVAYVVPEPSSVMLLGVAIVGLVGCAYRARRRRAM